MKSNFSKTSFSQCGEDLIFRHLLNKRIPQPTYLDIGAHHPWKINNTATFYLENSFGVNIEPDPDLFSLFETERPNDTNLNIGISDQNGILDFYKMSTSSLNTFSAEEAQNFVDKGYQIKETLKIEVLKVDQVLKQYFPNEAPDILSIDAEGLDEKIIKSFPLSTIQPVIICIETISFSTSGHGVKNTTLIEYIESFGYLKYADTNINTIFVKKDFWYR